MAIKVAELVAYIGVIANEKKARDFFNSLTAGKNVLFGLGAMAVGTSVSIGAMLNQALNASIALHKFNAITGLSAQTLQEWQHRGEAVGLTSDEIGNSIMSLNSKLARIRLTGQGYAPFGMMGIVPTDVWDVLDQLRKKVKSGLYDPQLLSDFMSEMGLSGFMPILKMTEAEYERFANKQYVLTDDMIKRGLKFNAAMKELGQSITYLADTALAELAPGMIDFIDNLKQWVDINRGDLKGSIVTITNLVKDFSEQIGGSLDFIGRLTGLTDDLPSKIELIGKAFIWLNPTLRALYLITGALDALDKAMSPENKKDFMGNFIDFLEAKGIYKDNPLAQSIKWLGDVGNYLMGGYAGVGPYELTAAETKKEHDIMNFKKVMRAETRALTEPVERKWGVDVNVSILGAADPKALAHEIGRQVERKVELHFERWRLDTDMQIPSGE